MTSVQEAEGKRGASEKWRVLGALALAELLGMALWFSASAVTPALVAEWDLGSGEAAWLTMSVQVGFVVGTFLSAFFNLADLINARRLFTFCALAGALCNGCIGLWATGPEQTLVLRFLTGVCLAGVYPPGMKIMATWFKRGRGMAIGVLVGALTLGSASPHLLNAVGRPHWRLLILMASLSALAAALVCALGVRDGPHLVRGARFDWRYIGRVLSQRGIRLANLGYLGHQWELYAFWTWIPLYLAASFRAAGIEAAEVPASASAFAIIGIGAVGCVVAGVWADRRGRVGVTVASLGFSGSCCLLSGLLYGGEPAYLVAFCLLWGLAVVADSAQYSASITEMAEPAYLGTVLTLQTCLGFLLTLVTIRLVPVWVGWVGWRWAFAGLALGPLVGAVAMLRLGRLPEAPSPVGPSA